jgi:hypothetical protein
VSKSAIRTLTLGRKIKFCRPTATVLATIVTTPSCSLTALDLRYCSLGGGGISELLAALLMNRDNRDHTATTTCDEAQMAHTNNTSKNVMKRLLFGTIHGGGDLDVLRKTIPNVSGLREVSVDLGRDLSPGSKESLLLAFKSNATLEKCTIDDEEIIFTKQQSHLPPSSNTTLSEMGPGEPEYRKEQIDGGGTKIRDPLLVSADGDSPREDNMEEGPIESCVIDQSAELDMDIGTSEQKRDTSSPNSSDDGDDTEEGPLGSVHDSSPEIDNETSTSEHESETSAKSNSSDDGNDTEEGSFGSVHDSSPEIDNESSTSESESETSAKSGEGSDKQNLKELGGMEDSDHASETTSTDGGEYSEAETLAEHVIEDDD